MKNIFFTPPPASLEEEASTGYTEVTMRQAHEMRMPVTMEVAKTHVRVTSVWNFPDCRGQQTEFSHYRYEQLSSLRI